MVHEAKCLKNENFPLLVRSNLVVKHTNLEIWHLMLLQLGYDLFPPNFLTNKQYQCPSLQMVLYHDAFWHQLQNFFIHPLYSFYKPKVSKTSTLPVSRRSQGQLLCWAVAKLSITKRKREFYFLYNFSYWSNSYAFLTSKIEKKFRQKWFIIYHQVYTKH